MTDTATLIERLEAQASYLGDTEGMMGEALAPLLRQAAAALRKTQGDDSKVPCREIMALYNTILGGVLPKAVKLPGTRRARICARWNDSSEQRDLKWWEHYFRTVAASDFLMGRAAKQWSIPGIDWLLNETNLAKVVEGNYKNRGFSLAENNRAMLGFGR